MSILKCPESLKFFLFILSLFSTVSAQENANKSRDERWREDIRFFALELPKRHKNLFFNLKQSDFEREVKIIETDVPKLSDTEIFVALSKLVAKVGDAHTTIDRVNSTPSIFPLGVFRFKEGWYAVGADEKYKEVLGARLVKINETPIEEAEKKISEVIPWENEYWLMTKLSSNLQNADVLQTIGIIPTKESGRFGFVTQDGKSLTVEIKSLTEKDLGSIKIVRLTDHIKPSLATKKTDIYWFEYLPDSKTLYIAYNQCEEDKNKPFAKFVEDAFAIADKENAERIVVDLRRNGGGNSVIMRPLLEAIKQRPQYMKKGKLFALTGRNTFSSGFMNARELQVYTKALLAGESSGQKPNAYGEVKEFFLPNTNLKVRYSTKYFELVGGETKPFLPVDIMIERTFADFAAGRDATFEKVLNYKDRK
jgi:hypothetical protein